MKIELNTENDASGHRLCFSITSAIARARDGLATIVIFATSAKIGRKDRDRERFACLGGYLSILCLLSEELSPRSRFSILKLYFQFLILNSILELDL